MAWGLLWVYDSLFDEAAELGLRLVILLYTSFHVIHRSLHAVTGGSWLSLVFSKSFSSESNFGCFQEFASVFELFGPVGDHIILGSRCLLCDFGKCVHKTLFCFRFICTICYIVDFKVWLIIHCVLNIVAFDTKSWISQVLLVLDACTNVVLDAHHVGLVFFVGSDFFLAGLHAFGSLSDQTS